MQLESLIAHIRPIVEEKGLEVVEVDVKDHQKNGYLRLFIDKPDGTGITVDDCAFVSRAFREDETLDGFFKYPYCFEVSSPGINRLLKTDADYERFLNKPVVVKTSLLINGQEEFKGTLEGYGIDKLEIRIQNQVISLERNNLASVRLDG